MEHVLNFDEFMKDKCGGGIKENIMCMKVWEKLVEEKNGSYKLCFDVSKKEKKIKKRHEKKKIERKEK